MRDVLDAFAQVRQAGAGWTARCPAHDDGRSSLSIGRGTDDRWLLKCHASCATADIVAAAGLSMSDLFAAGATSAKPRIVARYDYHDEGRALLYQVCRMDPKDFRQRRPNGKGWIWSLGNVRRVLYRLPELQGQTAAYIVEGEKDADRLAALGLIATTNAAGAGKWRTEYTQQLQAATVEHVVILPDNDVAGSKHAREVAASCHAAGLTVQIVELPGLPAKGDTSDWLEAGHTLAELLACVKAASVYTEQAPTSAIPARRAPIVTVLSSVEPQAIDWLWPNRYARGKYTLLAGEPGLGKSSLTLDSAARLSRGRPWPDGSPAPQGSSLFLAAEDGLADTMRPRLDALGGDPSQVRVLEAIRETDGTRSAFSLVRDLQMLADAIREYRPLLVVLDPITAYLGSVDTHRDSEVRAALAPLIDIIEQTHCALVAIGHLSKDAQRAALHRPGGSIAFVAAARIVLALAADQQDPERRLLLPLKQNICRPAPVLAYRIGDGGLVWESAPVTGLDIESVFRGPSMGDREAQTDAETLIADLLADVATWPMAAKDALQAGTAHGISDRTLQRAAKKAGIRISRAGFGSGGRWVWHRPEPIDDIPDTRAPKTLDVSSMAPMGNPSENSLHTYIDDNKSAFPRAREGRGEDDARF